MMKATRKGLWRFFLFLWGSQSAFSYEVQQAISLPPPPEIGYGSLSYLHNDVAKFAFDWGDLSYWIYYPKSSPSQSQKKLPVSIFLHGYGPTDPQPYESMLQHLAKKGHIIIYPKYGVPENPMFYVHNAGVASKLAFDALPLLASKHGLNAPRTDGLGIIGHSLGTLIGLNIAGKMHAFGLPRAKMLFLADPAGYGTPAYPFMPLTIDTLKGIPDDTFVFMALAEESFKDPSHPVFKGTLYCANQFLLVKKEFRQIYMIPSDTYQGLSLRSHHESIVSNPSRYQRGQEEPHCGKGEVDSVDIYAYWRKLEAALDAAFHHRGNEFVLGETPSFSYAGSYSDGHPVAPYITNIVWNEDVFTCDASLIKGTFDYLQLFAKEILTPDEEENARPCDETLHD